MRHSNNQKVFFELLRAGLWEKDVRISQYGYIDYSAVMRLAEEQAVVGLVAAGLEHVTDVNVPQVWALQFAGQTIHLEQRNKAMNRFIADLINKLRCADIYALLVKGQGIAQCYERPLWRAAGDVDLLFDRENYEKAKQLLSTLAHSVEEEERQRLHLGMTINTWLVELHGTMRGGWSKHVDSLIDRVLDDSFTRRSYRIWNYEGIDILLPSPDDDVIILFTHILQHYFIEGVGLRQLCDWCRLLYTYQESIDETLLKKRLEAGGLMYKWKTFASLAVHYLGMPKNLMPIYSNKILYKRNAKRILSLIMDTGSFGNGRDRSYKVNYTFFNRMLISFGRHTKDGIKRFCVFPMDALRVWCKRMEEASGFIINRKKI